MAGASMHLRLKRGNQTVFLQCAGTDTVGEVVARLAAVVGREPEGVRLVKDGAPLDGERRVDRFDLTTNEVVAFVYSRGEGEWEDPAFEDIRGAAGLPADGGGKKEEEEQLQEQQQQEQQEQQ